MRRHRFGASSERAGSAAAPARRRGGCAGRSRSYRRRTREATEPKEPRLSANRCLPDHLPRDEDSVEPRRDLRLSVRRQARKASARMSPRSWSTCRAGSVVHRIVRPRMACSCRRCETIHQVAAAVAADRAWPAGAGTFWRMCWSPNTPITLPLVPPVAASTSGKAIDLDRSTLADWVGAV